MHKLPKINKKKSNTKPRINKYDPNITKKIPKLNFNKRQENNLSIFTKRSKNKFIPTRAQTERARKIARIGLTPYEIAKFGPYIINNSLLIPLKESSISII